VVRACHTWRLAVLLPDEKQRLRRSIDRFSKNHSRWGAKRSYQHRCREGHGAYEKRVQSLWRLEGLRVPYRKATRRLRSVGTYVGAMSPIIPDAILTLDFQFDETGDSQQLKLPDSEEPFTRECLAIRVDRQCVADDFTRLLDELVATHGVSEFLR